MARHPISRFRRKKVFQESPFLDLPGEIRMLIYRYALIKPTPIDLWPREFIENPQDDPSLTTRIEKDRRRRQEVNDNNFRVPERSRRVPLEVDSHTPEFRRQRDLQYVRKEMATGILGTCTQICNEAGHLFWGCNTFRFSGDTEWFGARRFVTTIGSHALSQIRSLELFAPISIANCLDTSDIDEIKEDLWNRSKNEPKMHMAKAGQFRNPEFEYFVRFSLEDNVDHVLWLLGDKNRNIDLNFIVPHGFGVDCSAYNPRGEENYELRLPDRFLKMAQYFAKTSILCLEPGSFLTDIDIPDNFFTSIGIDVICQPGSFLKPNPTFTATFSIEVFTAVRSWKDPEIELSYLFGIKEMFDDKVKYSVAALGGRTNKHSGRTKTGKTVRVLKGFGGCRFECRSGFDCFGCNKTIIGSTNCYDSCKVWFCQACGTSRYWGARSDERPVILVTKIDRAMDRKEVTTSMYQGLSKRTTS